MKLVIRLAPTYHTINNMQSMIVNTTNLVRQREFTNAIVKDKTLAFFRFGNCGRVKMHPFVESLHMEVLVAK
jgi:hypothetical protein